MTQWHDSKNRYLQTDLLPIVEHLDALGPEARSINVLSTAQANKSLVLAMHYPHLGLAQMRY